MDFHLLIVRGRSASESLKLADGVTTVGRLDECQVRIKSSQVSRKHCELFEKKGRLLVKDLGSANGTFVNGTKIQGQQVLEPGDELTIGQVKLRVAKIGEAPPVKPSAAPSAGDTAVVEAISVSDGNDEEFEIDFDEEPESAATVDAESIPVAGESKSTAGPKATAEPKPSSPTPTSKKKGAEPPPEEAPMADEAIADFLLDLKVDEE